MTLFYKSTLMEGKMPKCPECGELIDIIDDMEAGEIIECDNCGLELEIVSLDPVELKIFEEEEK